MSSSSANSPTPEQIAALARVAAARDPLCLPALLWAVCRSTRLTKSCRAQKPTDADLATLYRLHPLGARLITASRAGRMWVRATLRVLHNETGLK